MQYLTQIVLNGLVLASTYCLIAVGLTLVFGVMRIMNFAQGELYMIGAYVMLWASVQLHLPFVVGILLAALVTCAIGAVLERSVFRPLRVDPLMGFIASLGISAILQIGVRQIFGSNFQAVPTPFPQQLSLFGAVFVVQRLFIVAAAAVLLLGLAAFLQRTRSGLAILASAEDPDAAALQGMSLNANAMLTMVVSAGLAGIAGAVIAPTTILDPSMGSNIILTAFVVVIVGGAGSIRGALVASFLLGFLQSTTTTLVNPTAATAVGLATMLIVLAFRPSGIFGRE
jgi:branched-chain amino acid transport system permease protein